SKVVYSDISYHSVATEDSYVSTKDKMPQELHLWQQLNFLLVLLPHLTSNALFVDAKDVSSNMSIY
ncbi:hypothetical protein H5410_055749, partial [Solanum commersonii]